MIVATERPVVQSRTNAEVDATSISTYGMSSDGDLGDPRIVALIQFVKLHDALMDFLRDHPELNGSYPFRDGY